MLIERSFLEVLDAVFEESHEGILVEVVGPRLHQQVAVVVHQAVIRLCVGAELGDLEVGILAADGLLFLDILGGGVPFRLRQ